MRLTAYTDYTLRVLMCLCVYRDRLVTIQEIADLYGISKNHLTKIVYQLGLDGIVETVRGRNGGLRLRKEPEDINLGAIVRSSELDFMMAECFDRAHNQCVLTPVCGLKDALTEATAAYLAVLDRLSLADLTRNKGQLRKRMANGALPVRIDIEG